MVEADHFEVTGHGGEFGIGSPARLEIKSGVVTLISKNGQRHPLDLHQCEASIVGTCLDVLDEVSEIGFSTKSPQVFAEILKVAPLDLENSLQEMATILYKTKKSKNQIYVFLLLISVGIIGSIIFFERQISKNVIDWIPISVDQVIGESVHDQMIGSQTEVSDGILVESLQKILDSLTPYIPSDEIEPRMVLIVSPEVNAYCLPGGYITVFTGLLELAESPDEVAAVLAHELAHATERHGLKSVARVTGTALAFQVLVGDMSGIIAAGGETALQLLNRGYGRDDEREADDVGLEIMTAAGWDPMAMSTFFERLSDQKNVEIPDWLSTHPNPLIRSSRIKESLRLRESKTTSSGVGTAPVIDWAGVKRTLEKL